MTSPWYRWQALLLLGSAALLLQLFEGSSLDLQVAHYFYDPALGSFPLRHHWLFEAVMHHGLKIASYIAVAASLFFCFLGYRGELEWLPRRNALLAGAGMLLIPIGTTLLKSLTNRHCPWDIVDFGGFAPYIGLLASAPSDIKAGQCFPAGHASAGFLWIVWAVALRPAGRNRARLGLLTGVLLGGLMGVARMAQGAHFLSHTLWSLWFAWAVSVVLAALLGAELGFPVSCQTNAAGKTAPTASSPQEVAARSISAL